MCGIFGGSARKGHELDIEKLNKLGLYNRSRGVDGFGYYYNGNLFRDADNYADFYDFLAENKFESGDLNSEVFMGHCRMMSRGTNTKANTHPFKINNLVLTHNGTIHNINQLVKDNNIHEQFNVDSKGLTILIEKCGFEVLEKYLGYAALAMTWENEPNSLYLYQGASKEKPGDKYPSPERPLFILHQPEGLYYSSLKNSLQAISSDDREPYRLHWNTVFEVVDGEFTNYEFKVDRGLMNIKLWQQEKEKEKSKKAAIKYLGSGEDYMNDNPDDLIRKESLPLEAVADDNNVYFRHGRYYLKGVLLDGELLINQDGHIIDNQNTTISFERYWFIRGVMMKSKYDYDRARDMAAHKSLSDYLNVAVLLSPYSEFPIFNLHYEGEAVADRIKNKWYFGGKMIFESLSFMPKFSTKTYIIEGGKTKEIKIGQQLIQIKD